ncbi:MAG: hypothetical protein EOM67_10990 [Spirochaetia bacterium]|nr:hypothetical protein [Spirochaetia bacterium]
MKRVSLLFFTLLISLSTVFSSFASMSESAFVFLEALEVLNEMNIISSIEYVVSEESLHRIIENKTIIANQQRMPPFLTLALHQPTFILTEGELFKEVLIPKIEILFKGDHPLEKIELILFLGEVFSKEYEAKEIYKKSKNDYLSLISFIQSLEKETPCVVLYTKDPWLTSFFRDSQIEVEVLDNQGESEPIFKIEKDGIEKWYSFSKRVNNDGYSDLSSSAILYPAYLLNDIISLIYLDSDESTLTYIKRILR